MKKLLVTIFSVFILVNIGIAQDEVLRFSEPVATGENYEVFGNKYPDDRQQTKLADLIKKSNQFKGQQVATTGTIKQVCQKKGCFFILTDGENEARITFKGYSFFIPTDAAGKTVDLLGRFRVKELSPKQAKYYAEDTGEDPGKIEGPQKEYNLVTTSVKIVGEKVVN